MTTFTHEELGNITYSSLNSATRAPSAFRHYASLAEVPEDHRFWFEMMLARGDDYKFIGAHVYTIEA